MKTLNHHKILMIYINNNEKRKQIYIDENTIKELLKKLTKNNE